MGRVKMGGAATATPAFQFKWLTRLPHSSGVLLAASVELGPSTASITTSIIGLT